MAGYRTHRYDYRKKSEFTGERRKNTLPDSQLLNKGAGVPLTAQQTMRLIKLTGTENIAADPDGARSFNGLRPYPYSQVDLEDYREGGQQGVS